MDSIFPGISVNPFKPVGVASYANAGRKAEATNTPRPPGGGPSQAEKSPTSQNKVAHPGRGRLIDYSV